MKIPASYKKKLLLKTLLGFLLAGIGQFIFIDWIFVNNYAITDIWDSALGCVGFMIFIEGLSIILDAVQQQAKAR